jgi:hypothetical protein
MSMQCAAVFAMMGCAVVTGECAPQSVRCLPPCGGALMRGSSHPRSHPFGALAARCSPTPTHAADLPRPGSATAAHPPRSVTSPAPPRPDQTTAKPVACRSARNSMRGRSHRHACNGFLLLLRQHWSPWSIHRLRLYNNISAADLMLCPHIPDAVVEGRWQLHVGSLGGRNEITLREVRHR